MAKKESVPHHAYENKLRYKSADHKQFGNVHERMKWLVGCKEELRRHTENIDDRELQILMSNLSVAVMDLESEVAYVEPVSPPYAKRSQSRQTLATSHYEHKSNK